MKKRAAGPSNSPGQTALTKAGCTVSQHSLNSETRKRLVVDGAKLYPEPAALHLQPAHNPSQLPLEWLEPRWYAVHTSSRHEKRVAEQLQMREVEHYLPLYTAIRRWNTRLAHVQFPLFPGYVFVYLRLPERLRVLEIPGVASLVGNSKGPISLPESDVNAIRASLSPSISRHAEPHPYLDPGARVRITAGPLAGLEGVVLRQNGRTRFVISVDLIMRSVAVNVDTMDISRLEQRTTSRANA